MSIISSTDVSLELISYSGDSRATALKAIKKAKESNFNKAHELMNDAKTKLQEVHKVHAEIIFSEAKGNKYEPTTLFMHAQDHFMAASVINDLAETIIYLLEKIK